MPDQDLASRLVLTLLPSSTPIENSILDNSLVNNYFDNIVVNISGDIVSQTDRSEPYQIIWLIRRLFRALAQKSNENLEGTGISAADRAVMEFLYPEKELAVPEIAERYQVSRQHIQTTVNSLLEKALVATKDNPRHKRSPLIVLNEEGRSLFHSVLKKDEEAVRQLFSSISENHLHVTQQTLQSLLNKLT